MKIVKVNPSIVDQLLNRTSKANEVFLKLLAKLKHKRNPFDEVRSQTY